MTITKGASIATSSDDPIFDDIRPCRDSEVHSELRKIYEDETLVSGILRFRYPILSKSFGFLLRPLIKSYVKKRCNKIKSIAEFQDNVAKYLKHTIEITTDGITFEGFENLDPKKGYLFVSNHRDISLDPAFVDLALHSVGFDTVRIAIGDNLLKTQAASSLMRLNKSFIVKRSVASPREKLFEINKLSAYIGLTLKEGHSIWIAQREGRAKDGDDKTELAVLKMFYMYGRSLKMTFSEYMKTLNIVPVSITYEFDPNDLSKARELFEKEHNDGIYKKSEFEDLESIVNGIRGYKGRVKVCAGAPIIDGFETVEELADIIDNFIWKHYAFYPSCLLSYDTNCKSVSAEDRAKFEKRINSYPENLRNIVLKMYAKPYENYQKVAK